MKRRLFRWTGGIVLTVLLCAVAATGWLVGTESGARWLLAQAAPLLPAELSIDEVNGTVADGLVFQGLGWTDPAITVTVAALDAKVELSPLLRREVSISRLRVRNVDVLVGESDADKADTGPVTVDIPIALQISDAVVENTRVVSDGNDIVIAIIKLGGRLSGSDLEIDRLEVQSDLADIGLSGNARLAGAYPVSANAAWEMRLQDRPPLSGVLKLDGDSSSYAITHDLDAPYEVATRGTVALVNERVDLDLENSWRQIRIEQGDSRVIVASDGAFNIAGTPQDLDFDLATTASAADIPAVAIEARGGIANERIDLESLSASNEWGRLLANGALFFTGEPRWTFDVELSDLDPAAADARLRGDLAVIAETSGRMVEQRPVLELRVADISGTINDYSVDGSGSLSYANKELRFNDAVVRVGDNRLDFAGAYGDGIEASAKARFEDLGQLGLGLTGALKSDFRVASAAGAFTAAGTVSGERLAFGDYSVDKLDAEFDLPAARDGTVSLNLDSTLHGQLAAEIDGRMNADQWSGTFTSLAVNRELLGEWTLREAADFSLSRARFDLEATCLVTTATAGEACVALDYDFGGRLRFETTMSALPLAALRQNLPQGATLLGDVTVAAQGEFMDGRLNSSAELQIDGLGLIANFEGDEVSALFEKAAVNANVVDNRLTGGFEFRLDDSIDHASGTVELDDLFDRESALRGRGNLELNDLTLLSFFFPDVTNPLGKIAGRVEIAGNLPTPEITGEVGLRDGSVDIRRAGISVTDIGLLMRQSKAGELALQGSARSGDGYLQIDGQTAFDTDSGIRSEIRLNGEDFTLVRLPDWQVTASPTIAVLLDERETRISGQLGIPQANVALQTLPESSEKPSPDATVHRDDAQPVAAQRKLFVDVTTLLGDDVSFSGFGLATGLEGSVRISGGTGSAYTSQGRVVLREGRYRAYGQNLDIESGELVFNGPLTNPALNVRATRTATDNTVAGIHLTGTPNQLKSDVYSEPSLPDAEALSYLLTGRPLYNASTAEGDMLNQAAFALGLTGAGNVASRVRNELGLDTLGFQGGAGNQQLVAGKRLNDRLLVEYAYGLVDSLGTLLLRYQLSKRLTVESRSGAVRTVDLIYTVKKP
ncbi:MAG: translocation/assembly module TamB domain-containing protein [Gammaproteobacteria bacterium]|nr:translocation/assembly module TamB domain-containing protein [Gammaproteobacteria bacterium]